MTNAAEWLTFGPALARPLQADRMRWQYMPAAPRLRRNADGTPAVTLVEAAGIVMMTATAEFGLDEAALGTLAASIVRREALRDAGGAALDPSLLQLEPAPLSITSARLQLDDGETLRDLARASPSGYGLQSAAFSAALQGAEAAPLKAALGGTRGALRVVYEGTRSEERAAEAAFTGDIADLRGIDPADAGRALDGAVRAGSVHITERRDSDASDALRQAALDGARAAAITALARMTGSGPAPGEGRLEASMRQTETAETPFVSTLDIRL